MSQSGHRPGSSNEEDERPILRSFQDGQTDSEDWITGLCDYVNTMREHYPGENHPGEEWLSKGFAMILLDRERTVATNSQQGTSGGETLFAPKSSYFAPIFQDIDLSNSASFCQVNFVLNLAPFLNRIDSSIWHLFCHNLS